MISQLWRYPVKSMRGESLPSLDLTAHGVQGDRRYAFESSGAPPGMLRVSGQERRNLLLFAAKTEAEGEVTVLTPDGRQLEVRHPALPDLIASVGNTVNLTESARPQTDVRPLALISLQTIALLERQLGQPVDPRRFRANLIVDLPGKSLRDQDTFPEDALVSRTLRMGTATIRILERDPRCRFISYDPDTTEPWPDLMKLLHARHQGRAGVYAAVVQPGTVAVGDMMEETARHP